MKINPISFKGIYKYKTNAKEHYQEFCTILDTKAQENETGQKLIIEHQNFDTLVFSVGQAINESEDITSLNWLLRHAEQKGIELPKFLTHADYNLYILTDKDKKDYEKTIGKREETKNKRKIVKKIDKYIEKTLKDDDTTVDIFLKKISAYAKCEQEVFDKFLEGRKIEPVKISFVQEAKNDDE